MNGLADPLQISRFLQSFVTDACEKGIKLSVGFDFEDYLAITRATPTKSGTYPNFRPDRSPINPGDGFWMVGVDQDDKVAVLQAVRLYQLSHSNFAEHLESLKAFYANPNKHAHARDYCKCKAPSAREIMGNVAYHGDSWVRSDFRGRGLPKIMAGIAFGVSLSMWDPDFICALVARWLLDKGVVAQYGYLHHEPCGSILQLVEEGIVDDDWLIWITGSELRRRVDLLE